MATQGAAAAARGMSRAATGTGNLYRGALAGQASPGQVV